MNHYGNQIERELELSDSAKAAKAAKESVLGRGVDISAQENDAVNNPKHYTNHPSGIECIQVTEHMGFNLGNAMKYIWRCDSKLDAIEDLEKAKWYLEREIAKRKKA